MFTYEKFYDHYCIKEDGKILTHVDTEAEAKKIVFSLKSENVDTTVDNLKNIGKNYTVYHLHTEYSLLDSCTKYKDYIDRAIELGQKSIGFSEHGNLLGWANKYFYCKEKGLKYLHGIEVYLTETLDEKIRDNYHTILIAKNQEGFKEINELYFLSTREDHVYYKPRLTFDEFLGISDNVIKISACVQSPLNKYMLKIKDNHTSKEVCTLTKLLKHYDYYEIQYHNMKEQIEFNQYLYKMAQRFNKPLIVGTDTHSLNSYKAECRTMLQYGKTDGVWGDEENECDLSYKTYDELVELFKKQNSIPMDAVLEALDNTNKMADTVEELQFDTHDKYPLLYGDRDEEVFWDMLRRKYKEKVERGEIDPNNPRYAEDIKEEMRVFKKINMIGFMLFMAEVMTWARENGIATGFSRGSVGGSTVAYMSDITDIDPIKWNTVFSRFANEYRVEAGDIDTDWYEDDRQKIYEYIINRFGLDKTSYILAVGTLADKSVIDVIGKAFSVKYGIKLGLKYDLVKNDPNNPYNLSNIAKIKKEWDADRESTREKYSDLFYYYDGLVGCIVSQSQHPAGIIVSPITLADNFGMFYGKDGQQILPIDMEECHEMGLIKFDILGLKSVGVIDKTFKLIGKKFPRAYEVDWEDAEVFEDITKDSTAIFQFESDFGRQSIRKMHPKSVDDICLCSACLRPSGESYREQVYARQWNKKPSKLIDEILSNSYGFLVYQEQTIAFLQQVCGFSGSEADNIRRAIGKKQRDKIDKALPQILEGYCEKSDKDRATAEEEAKQFIKVIEDASGYSFGFNHSESYAMLGYLMGWLRYHYPTEFCTSYLNCAKNDEDLANGQVLAQSRGVKIQKPIFRYSTSEYGCDSENKVIYKGIGSIKNIGSACGDNLNTLKDKYYDSFIDLLYDIKEGGLANKTEMTLLIMIDFFREFGDINYLLECYDIFMKLNGRGTLKVSELDKWGLTREYLEQHCEKATEKQFSNVDMRTVIKYICDNIVYTPITDAVRMVYEIAILGYSDITVKCDPKYYIVSNKETNQYGTTFVTMYRMCDGQYVQYKVNRRAYNEMPCDVGDGLMCYIKDQNKRVKVKTEDGEEEWVESDIKEVIVKDYALVRKFEIPFKDKK